MTSLRGPICLAAALVAAPLAATPPDCTTLPDGLGLTLPQGEILVGKVTVRAAPSAGTEADWQRLDLFLDGDLHARLDAPPWRARLDLGRAPRRQHLEAIAYDAAGCEMRRGTTTLNGGPHRFAVRLDQAASAAGGVELARVHVDVPAERRLSRVELYLDGRCLRTWTAPPFVHPLPSAGAGDQGWGFLQAIAYLENGASREDALWLGSTLPGAEVDVRAVELFVSVRDRDGRQVADLAADEFRVLEDGAEQTVRYFDTLDNLPLHVALLIDVSDSMNESLDRAVDGALAFFETVLRPSDRASVLTFSRGVEVRAPFTHDVERLRDATSGLAAGGGTRLYDSLAETLRQLGGLQGKRAVILLSDGGDSGSRLLFPQVLEYAVRSGVAVYAVGLDHVDALNRFRLRRLAEATGGAFFNFGGGRGLERIYRRIEAELRNQYFLVYQAHGVPGAEGAFRTVDVELRRAGLRAETVRGYYF